MYARGNLTVAAYICVHETPDVNLPITHPTPNHRVAAGLFEVGMRARALCVP